MTQRPTLTLASGSAIRASILHGHEIEFQVVKPGVDEAAIKETCSRAGMNLEATAMALAEAKCLAVAKNHPGLVVGSDQILEFKGEAFDKPADMSEARGRLHEMQGETHSLINATALAKNGEIIWRNVARPRLTMRKMSKAKIDAYLVAVGSGVLASVGAYQVETPEGSALFKHISGDYFAVQGLAIYPLLDQLCREGFFGETWVDAKSIVAGVVGAPISHSLSPLIHNEWARRSHVAGEYKRFEVPPGYEAFAAAMNELRDRGVAGVNVTLPHKENALRYADSASAGAQRIGAANMLSFTADGVYADNSDAAGFINALHKTRGTERRAEKNPGAALVLGAGGAARGVIVALKDAGYEAIAITNRTGEKAAALAEEFALNTVDWESRADALGDVDLLINTTALGMTGQPPLEIDLTGLKAAAVVYDIIYTPLETPLLKVARARGNIVINGLEMLMHQAAPGFSAWFANRPYRVMPQVDDDLRELLIAALKQGGAA